MGTGSLAGRGEIISEIRNDPALVEALIASYSILSLLHHRGLIDSTFNREDVKSAMDKLEPFAKAAVSILESERVRK